MRLVSYHQGGRAGLAALSGERLVDLVAVGRDLGVTLDSRRDHSLMRQLLEAGPVALERLGQVMADGPSVKGLATLDVSDVQIDVPISDPGKVICVGLNWASHADEVEMEVPVAPTLFAKFASSLAPDGAALAMPPLTSQLDYEAELAVVIGQDCRDVPTAEALKVVAGYTCFNDVSARDLQLATSQWLPGKALDGFGPCGPHLVTPDEIADVSDLRIRALVNDEVVQDDTTAHMIFPVDEIISYLSRLMTLRVGDVIATGTPPGVGMATSSYLSVGDVVRVEIDGIGTLTTPIVAPG